MKFALVQGQREEALPNRSGECPNCGARVIAKCGDQRVWHWAHLGRRLCDTWWENETEWHRRWKNEFPVSWQEVVHGAADGERHIADVKTSEGCVLEFQHSYIKPLERQSREAFYPKLVWVVDGMRRKRDRTQLINAINASIAVGPSAFVRKAYSDDCVLLREWSTSRVPVFFDFGTADHLIWLVGAGTSGWVYISPFQRAQFLEWHRSTTSGNGREIAVLVDEARRLITSLESRPRTHVPPIVANRSRYRRPFRL